MFYSDMCFVNNDEYLIITSSNQYSSHYYGCDNRNTVKIILNVILIPFGVSWVQV